MLNTCSNAPMMSFSTAEADATVILPHIAVVLASVYLTFAFQLWRRLPPTAAEIARGIELFVDESVAK